MVKRVFLIIILGIFLINFVSAAWEWDNVKQYDSDTNTVTIKNSLLKLLPTGTVAEATLETPQNVIVDIDKCEGGRVKDTGRDCLVAEIKINSYEDYTNVFNEIQFYNINKNMNQVNRNIKYKYKLKVDERSVNDYDLVCEDVILKNGSQKCSSQIVGNHMESIYEWRDLDISSGLIKGNTTVGLFTDVSLGEKIEWIPTIFGVRINEWASFEGSSIYASWELVSFQTNSVADLVQRGLIWNTNLSNFTLRGVELNVGAGTATACNLTVWQHNSSNQPVTAIDSNSSFVSLITGGEGDTNWLNITMPNTQKIINNTNYSSILNCSGSTYIGTSTSGAAEGRMVRTADGGSTWLYADEPVATRIWGIEYLGGVEVSVTLQSPDDAFETTNSTIYFASSAVATNSNITNTTLYVWNPDNTLYNVSTVVKTGTTNTSNISVSSIATNSSYKWNYFWCGENATSSGCFFASNNRTFTRKDFSVNSLSFNSTTYETAQENFFLNISSETTPSSAKLNYNGTEYTATITNTATNEYGISYDLQVPTGESNNSIIYSLVINTVSQNSSTYYQYVNPISFYSCNPTANVSYLNISFKDEDDLSNINASITTSSFVYYLGAGSQNKTLTYINSTEQGSYDFCFTPTDRDLYVNPRVQYKQGTTYPQRIWNPNKMTYTNTTTNQTLYLLSSTDGVYQYFTVLSQSGGIIEGVDVNGSRTIDGETVTILQGTTDGAGQVSFWANPDFEHTFNFYKSPYPLYELDYYPVGGTKEIRLGSGSSQTIIDDLTKEVYITLSPQTDFLQKNTTYNFSYTITSDYWSLDSWGFVLKYNNGSQIGTQTSTNEGGGNVVLEATTSNESRIIMEYFYEINDTYNNYTRVWGTYEANDFSLDYFFTRAGTYINANVLGFLGDDGGYFSKAILSILIIILVGGGLTMRYGIANEATIMGIITGVVLFLNTMDLLPETTIFESALLGMGDLLVLVCLIITFAFIVRGESR